MSKIIFKPLNDAMAEPVKRTTLRKVRSADAAGNVTSLYRLDVGSDDFDVQFTKAFRLSVAKALKENRLLSTSSAGTMADVPPGK